MAEIPAEELRARTRALLEEVHPDDPSVDRMAFRGAQFDHGLAFEIEIDWWRNQEQRRGDAVFYVGLTVNPRGRRS